MTKKSPVFFQLKGPTIFLNRAPLRVNPALHISLQTRTKQRLYSHYQTKILNEYYARKMQQNMFPAILPASSHVQFDVSAFPISVWLLMGNLSSEHSLFHILCKLYLYFVFFIIYVFCTIIFVCITS